jgi:hypothetical protein
MSATSAPSEELHHGERDHMQNQVDQPDTTLLHIANQGHPPLDIIKNIVTVSSTITGSSSILDSTHSSQVHTHLHVAEAWGASTGVIRFLVQIAPHTTALEYCHARTALQLHFVYCSVSGTAHRAPKERISNGA